MSQRTPPIPSPSAGLLTPPAPASPPSLYLLPRPVRLARAEDELDQLRSLLTANRRLEADLLTRLESAERRAKSALRAEIITRWITPLRTLLTADLLASERGEPGLSDTDYDERAEVETLISTLEQHDHLPDGLSIEERKTLTHLLHKYQPALRLDPEKIPIPHSGGDYELDYTPILEAIQRVNE